MLLKSVNNEQGLTAKLYFTELYMYMYVRITEGLATRTNVAGQRSTVIMWLILRNVAPIRIGFFTSFLEYGSGLKSSARMYFQAIAFYKQ